jgi:hypothetical protein
MTLKSRQKILFTAASSLSVLFLVVGISLLRQSIFPNGASDVILAPAIPGFGSYNHSRYLFIPFVLVLLNIVMVIEELLSRNFKGSNHSLVQCSAICVICIVRLQPIAPPDYLNWDTYAEKISSGWGGEIPIQPTAYGWTINVTPKGATSPTNRRHLSIVDLLTNEPDGYNNKRLIRLGNDLVEAFYQHPPSVRAVRRRPRDKTFVVHFGLDPRARNVSNGVVFNLRMYSSKGDLIHDFKNDPNDEKLHNDWLCLELPIPNHEKAGALTIEFETSSNGDSGYDWALWLNPQFTSVENPCKNSMP